MLVCVDARDARGCVSTLRLGCQTSSCCRVCVTRGIHSLAVAVLLLCAERLFARVWRRCVSRCDVRDRRSVAALSSGMTGSRSCGLSGCVGFGVTRTRCCA